MTQNTAKPTVAKVRQQTDAGAEQPQAPKWWEAHLPPELGMLYYRLQHLFSSPKRFWAKVKKGRQNVGAWLAAHKKQILWTLVALAVFSVLIGGAVSVYIWRRELSALARIARDKAIGFLARRAMPVVVVGESVSEAGVKRVVKQRVPVSNNGA